MLFYRAALPLSCKTLNYAAGIIRRHRKSIGSRWRKLNPGQQALLVLAYLRKGETFAELAAGFAVGTTTAWRYVEEVVALLAARAPKLRQAVRDAKRAGHAYVVLDGTLIPVDRVLPPSISGDLTAALREHGSATVGDDDEHYCHSRQALPMPGLRWRPPAGRSSRNAA
jgi:Helix-turn-helix of DDE superfamily endonuclease